MENKDLFKNQRIAIKEDAEKVKGSDFRQRHVLNYLEEQLSHFQLREPEMVESQGPLYLSP